MWKEQVLVCPQAAAAEPKGAVLAGPRSRVAGCAVGDAALLNRPFLSAPSILASAGSRRLTGNAFSSLLIKRDE